MSDETTSIASKNEEVIRKLVNDKIANDLTSLDASKQEAAASAAWRLAEIDRKANNGQLSLEQQRTSLMALSVLSTVKLTMPIDADAADTLLESTLAQLNQKFNDSQNKTPLPPEESIELRRQISYLSPDKMQMWPELTTEETTWLANENQRALNKLLISVAGPVASPLATAGALLDAPPETVKNLLEVGVGLSAAGGLQARMGVREPVGIRPTLEPISRGTTTGAAKTTPEGIVHNKSLVLDTVNTGMYPDPLQTTQNSAIDIKTSIDRTNTSPAANGLPEYVKGTYEKTLRDMESAASRVEDLNQKISQLEVGDAERLGKESIRGRVSGYFRRDLPVLEQAKVAMRYEKDSVEAPKSASEIKAFEARERLLVANNTPEMQGGKLVSRSSDQQTQQQIIHLQQEYQNAMEALWPKDLPISARANAPVLFKSDKLSNVYHITNPTGERTNCVSCADALIESIKGSPASANRYDDSLFHQVNNDILIKAHNIPPENIFTDFAGVEKLLLKWGDGAIAVVAGQRDNFKGHNFVVVNDAGKVRFLDRQADNDLLSPKGVEFNQIVVIRADTQAQRVVDNNHQISNVNSPATPIERGPER